VKKQWLWIVGGTVSPAAGDCLSPVGNFQGGICGTGGKNAGRPDDGDWLGGKSGQYLHRGCPQSAGNICQNEQLDG